jgi:hypothetical protein
MVEYDIQKSIQAQKKLCEEKGYPDFTPSGGVCWACKKNIYEPLGRKRGQSSSWIGRTGYRRVESCPLEEADYITGITVEKAGKELVTGCPHCNISYCD